MTILVTGATGTVGRHLVGHLLAQGEKVRALTRNPATAHLPEGVDVVGGDLTDTTTLAAAFAGVTAAHLINFGGNYQVLENGTEIVDLATAAGLGRVTVLNGWQEGTLEPAVRTGTLEWTFLNPFQFMSNCLTDWSEPLRTSGVVREPYGDRKSPPIHESDIAAVAAAILTQDGHHGQTYHLTGPEVLTARDMVGILGEATDRPLRFEELTPEQVRQEWVVNGNRPQLSFFSILDESGMSEAEKVDMLLHLFGTPLDDDFALTDTVQQVTGRPPRSFAQWAAEHADHFQPG
ncbi:NAD-dependent epimerase/dehydratase family protein [Nonomuraea sp. MG754425]|uniref:SDR family oxidoreductase n=1 Tax=Nonomuraea sp. MG754425 TaxID=2570319 RepID=UPI001F328789|nr:NmrA family NAD(P)-binding protein [Nonomuraea sp. MG754425]MCF6476753.1 NAD-dependent epimerase/dehydratase family protein [Nonomuraea sp. MG754425]